MVANPTNYNQNQMANIDLIVRCVNEMAELEKLAADPRVSSDGIGGRIRNIFATPQSE